MGLIMCIMFIRGYSVGNRAIVIWNDLPSRSALYTKSPTVSGSILCIIRFAPYTNLLTVGCVRA